MQLVQLALVAGPQLVTDVEEQAARHAFPDGTNPAAQLIPHGLAAVVLHVGLPVVAPVVGPGHVVVLSTPAVLHCRCVVVP